MSSKHSDLTPMDAHKLIEAWRKTHADEYRELYGDNTPLTSQNVYGLSGKSVVKGEYVEGRERVGAVITTRESASKPHLWFDGDAFATWFALYREGRAPRGAQSASRIAGLLSEYGL